MTAANKFPDFCRIYIALKIKFCKIKFCKSFFLKALPYFQILFLNLLFIDRSHYAITWRQHSMWHQSISSQIQSKTVPGPVPDRIDTTSFDWCHGRCIGARETKRTEFDWVLVWFTLRATIWLYLFIKLYECYELTVGHWDLSGQNSCIIRSCFD